MRKRQQRREDGAVGEAVVPLVQRDAPSVPRWRCLLQEDVHASRARVSSQLRVRHECTR